MNSFSRLCTPEQPMHCKKEELSRLYGQSKSIFPAENLINSAQMEIIDGSNWSFDPNTQTIWNDRYWKGFYPADYDLANLVMMYGLGFFKRFWPESCPSREKTILGETHPFLSDIHAYNQAIDVELPETGKAVYIKYRDFPFNNFDDVIKIIDKDTAIGEAFVSLRKPGKGLPIFHFVLSRRYSLDYMTQADCSFIFHHKATPLKPEEILGDWDLLLVSDAALSPPILRFRFLKGDAGKAIVISTSGGTKGSAGKTSLRAEFIMGGRLSHAGHSALFGEGALMSLDLPAQVAKNAIRKVSNDLLVGLLDLHGHPIFQTLQDFKGFTMAGPGQTGKKEKSELNLPYLLRRIFPKNEVRQ
ncbi:MAG: hypothetical protein PHQ34_04055 [Methanothrix sp.]|nr:hypothetical protein [Methanothrix sp.]